MVKSIFDWGTSKRRLRRAKITLTKSDWKRLRKYGKIRKGNKLIVLERTKLIDWLGQEVKRNERRRKQNQLLNLLK